MDSLFDEKELNQNIVEDKPETVLGMTFKSSAERRAYFREELRKKLPELKQIEGYPIGEDEDILNLSDPPYYTACPNPWLNEIIAEWEEDKKELEKEGKRSANFEVKEPYAYGIDEGKNNHIYIAHTYHTKVPHPIIMRYILHYTQPGDIVLDSFCGTGMTGVASALCEDSNNDIDGKIYKDFNVNHLENPIWGVRHSICGDLSPLSFHIASNYNSSVNLKYLKNRIVDISRLLKERFNSYYEVQTEWGISHVNYFVWSQIVACHNCGTELNVHNLSYDYNTRKYYEKLECPNCGLVQKHTEADLIYETVFDKVNQVTIQQTKYECCLMNVSTKEAGRKFSNKIKDVRDLNVKGFIPHNDFGEGYNINQLTRTGCKKIFQIYPPRTQCVLAYLYDLINEEPEEYKHSLMFIFTSMLPKLTRLNRYMPQHGSRALVGPMTNVLYLPPQYVENNPIDQFEFQSKKILKALSLCKKRGGIQITSATHCNIKDSSVDYIFTDPPFGKNIMYSELNTVSESWLKVKTNNKEEAISNPNQNKGLYEYQDIMSSCFKEYYRVLKPNKWMTVEFSNTSAAFWNALQYAIKNAGFVIASITDLNKERGGLYAMIGPTAVKQDLAISCYKPSSDMQSKLKNRDASVNLWDFVEIHLNHLPIFISHSNFSKYITERDSRIIYDRVVSYFIQNGLTVPMDSVKFQQELKERFVERDGMYFTSSQVLEYEEKRKSVDGFVPMGIIVSDEANGIEWLKHELETPQTYQDIQPKWMQAINGVRKGDRLPELRDLLEENFIKDEEDRWRNPDMENAIDLERLRTKALMKEFRLYVELAQKPKSKIKEVRVEALRAGFKQCYKDKDYELIVLVGDKIPENILTEDEVLLQYYDIASSKI